VTFEAIDGYEAALTTEGIPVWPQGPMSLRVIINQCDKLVIKSYDGIAVAKSPLIGLGVYKQQVSILVSLHILNMCFNFN
jgi:hypothetical protein